MPKPNLTEFDEYYHYYVGLVPSENLLNELAQQNDRTQEFLNNIPNEREEYRYAEKKWTIKEIVIHLTDCERIFSDRVLRFARNDKTELPAFDHNNYVVHANCKERALIEIAKEYRTVRMATIALFKSLDSDAFNKNGIAAGKQLSVNALGFICVGHEIHHRNVIEEKYLIK